MKEMMKKSLLNKIEALVEPVVNEENIELVEVVLESGRGSSLLRVIIDRRGGVTIDDCQHISKRLNYILEVEEIDLGTYRLEVSSPGIFCELKRPADFLRNTGKRVVVHYHDDNGKKKKVQGMLEQFEGTEATVACKGGETITVPFDSVTKAKLDPELFPASNKKAQSRKGKKWAGK